MSTRRRLEYYMLLANIGATPDEIEDLAHEAAEDLAEAEHRVAPTGWTPAHLGERSCDACGGTVPALPRCERCGVEDPACPF